jgi:hypothetical protein
MTRYTDEEESDHSLWDVNNNRFTDNKEASKVGIDADYVMHSSGQPNTCGTI